MAGKDSLALLEEEILAEKASALGRLGRTLESLLVELAQPMSLDRYRELRREVLVQRWYLIVTREAIGFRDHRDLDRLYPIPPPR